MCNFLTNMLKVSHCCLLFDEKIVVLALLVSRGTSFYVHIEPTSLFTIQKSPEGVADADLVLLVTTRPTTGNTLAWAVACERDQWGRAIAGKYYLTWFLFFV